jgi:transglutaminase-like putative cysteine protease
MVIGLILLGVAGTISQTLAFAPWLILFLLLALPTLVLDYRSRLGLDNLNQSLPFFSKKPPRLATKKLVSLQNSPLSPKSFGIFFLTILFLGLTIFALMPRFPGYQIQSFPVNSPAGMENQDFEQGDRQIVNPGYVREGETGNGGVNDGNSPTTGSGQLDSTFYYGFNSQINQNLRGSMTPEIVMRVRSQAPGFWRAMAFDRYTGQGWQISREQEVEDLNRSSWSYRFFVPLPATQAKTHQVVQTYSIVSSLPNIIPALTSPQFLFFPTRQVSLDRENSLRSPGGLAEGLTYTVISQVPERNRSQLRSAPETYPKSILKYYLQIPAEIAPKVRRKTEELLAKSPTPLTSPYEKALYLAQALKQNYELTADLPFLAENEDLVSAFLFRFQGGYADHFSTVLTIMLRSIGIPARLATGFAPGQFNPFTGFYVVQNTDAYAITEVFFPGYGWYTFDPIPGHELIPPSFEEAEPFSVLKQFWQWVAGWLPSPVTGFLGLIWENVIVTIGQLLAWLWRFISGSLLGGILGGLVGVVFAYAGWLGWGQFHRWRRGRKLAKLPPIERLYQQMLGILTEAGYGKHPAQTPLEYAAAARIVQPPPVANIIEEIARAYVDWRYGGKSANIESLRQRFREFVKLVKK